ncbi:hypothetical protein V6N12_024646 [Hibiscus sabdariffa]|uniref:Uncharacterized protein n=1 Tax=Hibiscus sabdariffa TaxID=183260 RepID=A0ABR2G199_9ROSI
MCNIGKTPGGKSRLCMIKYEKLPNLYYWYEIIGHRMERLPEDKSKPQYGPWMQVESSCKELNKQADTETEKEDIDISGQVVVHGDTTITSSRLEGRPRKRSYKRYNQGQYEADSHENTKKLKTSEERDVKEQNVEPTEAATQPRQEP